MSDRYLDLRANFIYGSFPSVVTTLTKLKSLYLCCNYFNGSLPAGISVLTGLTAFDINGQYGPSSPAGFSGTLPRSMSTLTALRWVLNDRDETLTSEVIVTTAPG